MTGEREGEGLRPSTPPRADGLWNPVMADKTGGGNTAVATGRVAPSCLIRRHGDQRGRRPLCGSRHAPAEAGGGALAFLSQHCRRAAGAPYWWHEQFCDIDIERRKP